MSARRPAPAVIAIVGDGVVGRRVARRFASYRQVGFDTRTDDVETSRALDDVSVAVLAQPGPHHECAVALVERGIHVVSVGDQVGDLAAMLDEGDRADHRDATLVVGAGMAPGLTGLVARHLASSFADVDEIHVALHGTAGPSCARQHHRALAGTADTFHDGAFSTARAGSGRELAWFPEPVGSYDCYRAELPVPMVMHRAFPTVGRITARLSANRRDRLTSRLPMLTPPHEEGGVGAIRVELRGADADGGRLTLVAGIAEMVGSASAATASTFVEALVRGELEPGLVVPGEERLDTLGLLRGVERFGVRLQEFTGEATTASGTM